MRMAVLFLTVSLCLCLGGCAGAAGSTAVPGGKTGDSIADKMAAKLAPVAGEQMTPTADQLEADTGTFMFDRLFAIADADPAMKVANSGNTPGVDWESFSDGSKLEFKSEVAPDGSQHLISWTVIAP